MGETGGSRPCELRDYSSQRTRDWVAPDVGQEKLPGVVVPASNFGSCSCEILSRSLFLPMERLIGDPWDTNFSEVALLSPWGGDTALLYNFLPLR